LSASPTNGQQPSADSNTGLMPRAKSLQHRAVPRLGAFNCSRRMIVFWHDGAIFRQSFKKAPIMKRSGFRRRLFIASPFVRLQVRSLDSGAAINGRWSSYNWPLKKHGRPYFQVGPAPSPPNISKPISKERHPSPVEAYAEDFGSAGRPWRSGRGGKPANVPQPNSGRECNAPAAQGLGPEATSS